MMNRVQFLLDANRRGDCLYFMRGREGLYLSLQAMGVGAGHTVVIQGFTCLAVAAPVLFTGSRPVYADIDPATYLMDVDALEQVLSERTRCIIPVHLFGQCVDMDRLNAVAADRGFTVLEDCAQSTGAIFDSVSYSSCVMPDVTALMKSGFSARIDDRSRLSPPDGSRRRWFHGVPLPMPIYMMSRSGS